MIKIPINHIMDHLFRRTSSPKFEKLMYKSGIKCEFKRIELID